jgi:hydrogenase maturation protein HypF
VKTWHLHIEGQVQGVGFRPFVYLLAQEYQLNGRVNNALDGVHIKFNAKENKATEFSHDLLKKAPPLSRITGHHLNCIEDIVFDDFQINHSKKAGDARLLLTPDIALCQQCKTEMHSETNRRMTYPFITCTNCGPRYSIITDLPYDREATTMAPFQMCPDCLAEYENPVDRRYYSQTNSCPVCRIELALYTNKEELILLDAVHIIEKVPMLWQRGKIIAIKGIGGYILTCDAQNVDAIQELRRRKHRPSKPFALMYPNINFLENDVALRTEERLELQSIAGPIVLVPCPSGPTQSDPTQSRPTLSRPTLSRPTLSRPTQSAGNVLDAMTSIAPNLNQVGVMLPYTPLYDLLLFKFGKAIVATSGNISNSPIIYDDQKALKELSPVADFILTNNRDIVIPQDDSVVKFTTFKNQKIILRRSRGMAPTYINAKLQWPKQNILATGAALKSTFTFLHQGNTIISQYLGDLEHFDTQVNYDNTVQHLFKLLHSTPDLILTDLHPEYASTRYGNTVAGTLNVPIGTVQHHIAHFGAVLAENDLILSEVPVLGVVWDGTGLGEDGQIWGGEFFIYEQYAFSRPVHFDYFDFILGDKMPKEPRISALAACWDVEGAEGYLKDKFSATEWQIYMKMLKKGSQLSTSSVGRIFDAVASLLGVMDRQTYEGEAAMQLEAMATQYFQQHGLDSQKGYLSKDSYLNKIPTKVLMHGIIQDLRKGKNKDFIAARFHYSLMQLIIDVAHNLNIKKIAFTGGVFQNGLLVDLIRHNMDLKFDLYFHNELSPNDENVSFGQLACHQIRQYELAFTK